MSTPTNDQLHAAARDKVKGDVYVVGELLKSNDRDGVMVGMCKLFDVIKTDRERLRARYVVALMMLAEPPSEMPGEAPPGVHCRSCDGHSCPDVG